VMRASGLKRRMLLLLMRRGRRRMKVMRMRRLLLPLRQADQPACAGCRPETADGGLWTPLLPPPPRRYPSLRHCHSCRRLKAHAAKVVGQDEKSESRNEPAQWSGGGAGAGCSALPCQPVQLR
jgi:hypothetical protein